MMSEILRWVIGIAFIALFFTVIFVMGRKNRQAIEQMRKKLRRELEAKIAKNIVNGAYGKYFGRERAKRMARAIMNFAAFIEAFRKVK